MSGDMAGTEAANKHADSDNPFEIYRAIKSKGILGMVIDDENISDKTFDSIHRFDDRELSQGNAVLHSDTAGYDVTVPEELLYVWYLGECFNNYSSDSGDESLSYEMEYIINGAERDRDNLSGVVLRLLGVRELCNIAAIVSSERLMREAHTLAISISAAAASPALIEPIRAAVVAIWALVESVLDVRTLLHGGRISLVKSIGEWTSRSDNLGSFVSGDIRAIESEQGISYMTYLYAFIYMLNDKDRAYRPMELMENEICKNTGCENLRMNNLMYSMKIECLCEGEPELLSFVTLSSPGYNLYKSRARGEISYIKK